MTTMHCFVVSYFSSIYSLSDRTFTDAFTSLLVVDARGMTPRSQQQGLFLCHYCSYVMIRFVEVDAGLFAHVYLGSDDAVIRLS